MSRRRRLIAGVLCAFLAFAGPAFVLVGADRGEAAFGDSESIGLNELAAASVSVAVGLNTVVFDVSDMAPGDRFTGQIELANDGTLPLRFALEAERRAGDQQLLDVLDWRIWPALEGNGCSTAPRGLLFEGVLSSDRILGDSAIGQDAGDRTIEPGLSELICLDVLLPIEVSNAFQGSGGAVEMFVIAEHAIEAMP